MSPDNERDLDELRQLPRVAEPPAELEDRVVAALAGRGLLRPSAGTPSAVRRAARPLLIAASILLAALLGWLARDLDDPSSAPAVSEDNYMVLLSEPRSLETTKPISELVAEYRQWAASLAERGKLVTAARLEPDGFHLVPTDDGEIRRTEADWRLATGFFVIRASSYDEAAALLADCPHLTYGGEVSLRKVASGA